MTWVADSLVITTAVDALGYERIPGNLKIGEQPMSYNNKSYTLTLGQPQLATKTNDKEVNTNYVRLHIIYKQTTVGNYDSNYDSFLTVHDTIKGLAGFVSWNLIDYQQVNETNKESKGILEFYYGVRTC